MPLPALGELPQLTALSLAWRHLVDLKPVLILVNNTGLVCCWEQRGRWQQRVVGWPEGVCRDGVPLQREAVGELIADLIFDCDCPGAELVLCRHLRCSSSTIRSSARAARGAVSSTVNSSARVGIGSGPRW